MTTYAKAKADFKYLESIDPLNDWVEIMAEIESFMEEPTKKFALGLYVSCINLWFSERQGDGHTKRVERIRERW